MEIIEYFIGEDEIEVYYKHEKARRINTAVINKYEFEEWLIDQGIFGEQEAEINHHEQPVEYVRWVNDWSNYEQGFREDQIKQHIIDFRMSLKE